jgi:acyl carrier protein
MVPASPHGTVFDVVRRVILEVKAEATPVHADRIGPESRLDALPLAMDSVDLVKLVVGLEIAFDLVAEPTAMLDEAMLTVADVVAVVERMVAGGLAGPLP